jgi:hypothetical protein
MTGATQLEIVMGIGVSVCESYHFLEPVGLTTPLNVMRAKVPTFKEIECKELFSRCAGHRGVL